MEENTTLIKTLLMEFFFPVCLLILVSILFIKGFGSVEGNLVEVTKSNCRVLPVMVGVM